MGPCEKGLISVKRLAQSMTGVFDGQQTEPETKQVVLGPELAAKVGRALSRLHDGCLDSYECKRGIPASGAVRQTEAASSHTRCNAFQGEADFKTFGIFGAVLAQYF